MLKKFKLSGLFSDTIMRNIRINLLISVLLTLVITSCSSGKFPGFEEGENGVYYKVHYRGNGSDASHDSGWMKVNMDYRLKDSVLFTSKTMDEDFIFPTIKPLFKGDLYEGMKMMNEGDSMSFAIVADSFYLITANAQELPDFVQPGDPFYFDVKLLKRYSNDEYKALQENKKEEKRREESLKLAAYLEKNSISTEALPSGLIFIPLKEGSGKRPDTGEMCRVYLKVEVLDGDLLYNNFENGDPIDVEYGKGFDTDGFREGLGRLKVGGKAKLIVPSNIGVGERGMQGVPAFTTLVYEIQLDDIKSVKEVKKDRAERKKAKEAEIARLKEIEPERIQKYLVANDIQQQPTESGLYVVELISGNGVKPVNGDVVKLHYTLFTIEGEKLDSSYDRDEPIQVTLNQNQVIKGWEEGIQTISEGGKSRIIMPSSLAYGEGQNGKILPYSPLIFEIELLEIVNK